MKIKYSLDNMPVYYQPIFVGDLMRYHAEEKAKLLNRVNLISTNETIKSKVLNTIRNYSGLASLTIEQFIYGLETAAGMDIFSFKINGVDPCDILKKDGNIDLEIFVNPVYFATHASIDIRIPGFRKPKAEYMEQRIKELTIKARDKWIRDFEKELYSQNKNKPWKNKKVLEDD